MKGTLLYLESSALVKLVWTEHESDALRDMLSLWPDCVSWGVLPGSAEQCAPFGGLVSSALDLLR